MVSDKHVALILKLYFCRIFYCTVLAISIDVFDGYLQSLCI